MAKTWDTSRTGGGTYEFTQDAQGNYTLGSVGFDKLSKLNLPELKKEATTTAADTTKAAATVSAQTKQAFGDVQPFYYDQKGEGGTDTQYTMRKEGDLSTETKPMTTGDGPWTMRSGAAEKPGMLGDTGGSIKRDIKQKGRIDTKSGAATEHQRAFQVARANYDQNLATKKTAKDPNRFTGIVGPQKPSPYQDAIMRGETGVKYSKPDVPQIARTKLKQVNSTLKTLSNVAGLVFNPIATGAKMVLGAVKDTPTQTHDRQYFNTRGDNTSRIAGNPTTDLYAGFNQTSAFGNLEKAGERRIANREKTIAKKGYKAGDKFFDDTQNMKNQQKDYRQSKAAAKNKADLATGGVAPGASGGNGGCFLKGTPITMANGTTKPVDQVDLGDKVAEGGKVFAAGRFLINNLYDYKGIKVSGSHMVNEDGTWTRIEDSKHGKSLGDDEYTVYVFGAENRRILINGILFTDYFEVSEQDRLTTIGDKYFEEWRDHDKILVKLEENHNVSVLNNY